MTAAVCPDQGLPELLECPRGCGLVVLANPDLGAGPWRMQVHLAVGPRCPIPFPGSKLWHLTPAELRRYRSNHPPRGHKHRGH